MQQERLVLISAYDPSAGFQVGHAMNRNKSIYALSDAALVVTSDLAKGGTWAGAIEQLEKLRYVPLFIHNGPFAKKGNQPLLQKGGLEWPDPQPEDLQQWISEAIHAKNAIFKQQKQRTFSFAKGYQEKEKPEPTPPTSPADQLLSSVQMILLQVVRTPMKPEQIADQLGVSKTQANAWLKRLTEQGALEKKSHPVRYVRREIAPPQTTENDGKQAVSKQA